MITGLVTDAGAATASVFSIDNANADQTIVTVQFLARDSMLSALYAIARPGPSVCLSVRLSHGWITKNG